MDCDKNYESFQKHQEGKGSTPDLGSKTKLPKSSQNLLHNESFSQLSESTQIKHVRKAVVLSKRSLNYQASAMKESQEFTMHGVSFSNKQLPSQRSSSRHT